jgi:hypothetical protein
VAKRRSKPTRAEAIAALQATLQYATRLTQHGLQDERPEIQAQTSKKLAECLNDAAQSLGAALPEEYVLVRGFQKGTPLAIFKMSEPQGLL